MLTVEEACNQELDFLLIQEPDKFGPPYIQIKIMVGQLPKSRP
jgi:hypothetical protein